MIYNKLSTIQNFQIRKNENKRMQLLHQFNCPTCQRTHFSQSTKPFRSFNPQPHKQDSKSPLHSAIYLRPHHLISSPISSPKPNQEPQQQSLFFLDSAQNQAKPIRSSHPNHFYNYLTSSL